MNRFDDMIRGLQKDIQVPESVWNRYIDTLDHLPERSVPKKSFTFSRKKLWPVAAAIAFALGTLTVSAAVYTYWKGGLEEKLQITSAQDKKLEDEHMRSFLDHSVTQGNITVTAQESIVDHYFAHLSFKIEGYNTEDGEQPAFSETDIIINHDRDFPVEWTSSFYQGIIPGSDGKMMFADGTPFTAGQAGSYKKEDGSMEFQITLMSEVKGAFLDQPIHIELKDLGIYTEEETLKTEVKGTWSFDWILEGSKDVETYDLNTSFSNGSTLLQAELSPISVSFLYQCSQQDGTKGEAIPTFTGVRLKDGTLLTGLSGQGYSGCQTEDPDLYRDTFALERVLDVEQIESLLFIRPTTEVPQDLTEEDLYFVPVS